MTTGTFNLHAFSTAVVQNFVVAIAFGFGYEIDVLDVSPDHIDETPVYVGKSCQTFRKRFKQHIDGDKLFLHKKGELYVRLGKIVEPQSLATYEKVERGYDRLLLTIESGLITELRNLGYKVMRNLTNVQQTNTYTLWYNLIIQNSGYRGLLPSEIDNIG